ncbi:MAG: hypothetical protein WDO13_19215 [Verrucomicrobiota bacterium]
MTTLAHDLISALATFDAQLPGLGLYACHEHQAPAGKTHPYWKIEWEMALRPRLAALGCVFDWKPVFGKMKYRPMNPLYTTIRFLTPDAKVCDLRLVRTSKVKVRRYGSGEHVGYHVDRTVDFDFRWAQLKMEKQIRQLWWPDRCQLAADIRLLLFLGFDKAQRPFHAEMTALEKTSHRLEHHIGFASKSWPDTHGREFNLLAACWSSSETSR